MEAVNTQSSLRKADIISGAASMLICYLLSHILFLYAFNYNNLYTLGISPAVNYKGLHAFWQPYRQFLPYYANIRYRY
ncbi:hypothetical protein BHC46_06260 [Snodgrassella alvi]|uniref:Uncharacterized protein n=1 Tax=Snodgrassella alvi TaxID=1196083 RepID=A0A2N9XHS2_9NEIS|nr:hypothetical protein BHC46_06260 [Snodgrassella alvi]